MAERVKAEIVANALDVLVHEGDTIVDGDTVVLPESTRMEIPVLVTRRAAHEGDLIAVVE